MTHGDKPPRQSRLFLALALMVVWLPGCMTDRMYQPPAGQKMSVSQEVMAFYKEKYLPNVTPTHAAAFAVSESGRTAGLGYCPNQRCKSGMTVGQLAIQECTSSGEKCYVFAVGSDIKVDYQIVP